MGIQDMTPGELRMSKARSRMLSQEPWFGHLAMKLNMVEVADQNLTMSVDGTNLYFNSDMLEKYSLPQIKAIIAHEVMHCALKHMYRINDRDLETWNEACDYAINPLLQESGFEMPPDALMSDRYKNEDGQWMSAEQIYSIMQAQKNNGGSGGPSQKKGKGQGKGQQQNQNQNQDDEEDDDQGNQDKQKKDPPSTGDFTPPPKNKPEDQNDKGKGKGKGDQDQQDDGQDQEPQTPPGGQNPPQNGENEQDQGGGGQPPPPPNSEADWEAEVAMATAICSKAGTMPGHIEKTVKRDMKPEPNCWEVLKRFLERNVPSGLTYARPNRRYIAMGLYLPGPLKENMPRFAMGNDTSGSIADDILALVMARVNEFMLEHKPEALDVYHCDTEVYLTETFDPEDGPVKFSEELRRGGTAFQPVFEAIKNRKDIDQPCCCLYFSADLENFDHLVEPPFPVLWITSDTHRKTMPFGEVIRIPHPTL